MTTAEILAGMDRSLAAIVTEREQLLAARAQLTGDTTPNQRRPRTPRRRSRRRRGDTTLRVLEALDLTEAHTAGDVARITNIGRALAGTTLSRLVQQGKASKADRGYLRVGAL